MRMPATSAVLTGLSLATGIAREATDGVPIVKQVLGVASRIVELAEKVDKNREDLHALADRAKNMDATITDIIGDRELDNCGLLRRLEDMNRVLRAVEKHFEKHIQRGRVRKTFGYIFTVRKEVDRLKGEFDDRLRELEVAASLDTNISAKRDARFNGEFRNIRHCEIELLRRITPQYKSCQRFQINCHLATCDGSNQVVVVREIVVSGQDEDAGQRIEAHDNILELLSLVQNRHPNIAYLYGRNAGPKDNRFAVLKAGDIRLLNDVVNGPRTAKISYIGRIVAKLMDVTCHLQKYGASWAGMLGIETNLYLDKNHEPKIGIQDDLYTIQESIGLHASGIQRLMAGILQYYCVPVHYHENDCPRAHSQCTKWRTELLGKLSEAKNHWQEATVFQRADIPNLIPLSQESQMYLRQSDRGYFPWLDWGIILLDFAMGGREREGSFLYAIYYRILPSCEEEQLFVDYIDVTIDTVYFSTTRFGIPISAGNEVRERLGIPASNDDAKSDINGMEIFNMRRFAGPNSTSIECSGWRAGNPYKHGW